MTKDQLILSDDTVVTFGELRLLDLAATYDEKDLVATVTGLAAKVCHADGEPVGADWLRTLTDEDAARVIQHLGDVTARLAARVNDPLALAQEPTDRRKH